MQSQKDRLLDLARETYQENLSDAHQLCVLLAERHCLPLTVKTEANGCCVSVRLELILHFPLLISSFRSQFEIKGNDASTRHIPDIFINVKRKKNCISLSTLQMVSKRTRLLDHYIS